MSIVALFSSCVKKYDPEQYATLFLVNTSSYHTISLVADQDTLVLLASELSNVNGYIYFTHGYGRWSDKINYFTPREHRWDRVNKVLLDGKTYIVGNQRYKEAFYDVRKYTQHPRQEWAYYLPITNEYIEQLVISMPR